MVQILREEFEQAEKDGLDDGTLALIGSVAFVGLFLAAIIWRSVGYSELASLPLLVAIGLFVLSRQQKGRIERSSERRRRVETALRPRLSTERPN